MTQPTEKSEARTLSSTVRWLEEEQRQSKAQGAKLQQLVDQMQTQVWDQTERLRKLEDALTDLQTIASRLIRVEEDSRQARELMGRFQTGSAEATERLDEVQRTWQTEMEHERVQRAEIQKQAETSADILDKASARLQSMEESFRRNLDSFVELKQGVGNFGQRVENLESRVDHGVEQHKRWQNETSRINRELESLHEQEGIIMERLRLLAEQPKRLEEQMAAVMAEEAARRRLQEQVELGRAERERLAKQGAEFEQALSRHDDQFNHNGSRLSLLETRGQSAAGHLAELREQFWNLRQQLFERLSQLFALEEEHKRRRIEDLDQQIKEIKQCLSKPLAD
ncbi:MAG: hypothetical protein ABIH46_05115 [Chloroflexota bacterium]